MSIEQYYATSCTKGSSAITRATGAEGERFVGYGLRATSVAPKQASRANSEIVTRYVKYRLPNDDIPDFETKYPGEDERLILNAENSFRRFIYDIQRNGCQVFGKVCYRQTDASKSQRPGSYFGHILSNQPEEIGKGVSPVDMLRSWESPFWVSSDNEDLPHDLPVIELFGEVLSKPSTNDDTVISDEVFFKFLTAPAEASSHDVNWPSQFSPCVFPARWRAMEVGERQQLFARLLRNYAHPKRNSIYLVAEPALAALLFYGIARLLPKGGLQNRLTFSTYEELRVDRAEATAPSTNSRFQLIATIFNDPATELRKDVYTRFNFQNTFTGQASNDIPNSNRYVDVVLPMLIEQGWEAVDQLTSELSIGNPKSFADLDELLDARETAKKVIAGEMWENRQRAAGKQQEFVRENTVNHFSGVVPDAALKALLSNPDGLNQIVGMIKSSPNADRCVSAMSYWVEHWPEQRFADLFESDCFSDLERQKAVRAHIRRDSTLPVGHEYLWKNVKATKSTEDAILTKLFGELQLPAIKKLIRKYFNEEFPNSKTGPVELCLAMAFASAEDNEKVELAMWMVNELSEGQFVDFVARSFAQGKNHSEDLLHPKLYKFIAQRVNGIADRIIGDAELTHRYWAFLNKNNACLNAENKDCVLAIGKMVAVVKSPLENDADDEGFVGVAMNTINGWTGKKTQADIERKSKDKLGKSLAEISYHSKLSNRVNLHFAGKDFRGPAEDPRVWRQVGEYVRDVLVRFGQQKKIEERYFPEGFSLIHSGGVHWRHIPLAKSKKSTTATRGKKHRARHKKKTDQGMDKVFVALVSIAAGVFLVAAFGLGLKMWNTSFGNTTAALTTEPPTTEPPTTEPPATEPPATEPPTAEPPTTEPPATEPPAAEPPAAEPPAAEPPAAEPPAAEPPTTDSTPPAIPAYLTDLVDGDFKFKERDIIALMPTKPNDSGTKHKFTLETNEPQSSEKNFKLVEQANKRSVQVFMPPSKYLVSEISRISFFTFDGKQIFSKKLPDEKAGKHKLSNVYATYSISIELNISDNSLKVVQQKKDRTQNIIKMISNGLLRVEFENESALYLSPRSHLDFIAQDETTGRFSFIIQPSPPSDSEIRSRNESNNSNPSTIRFPEEETKDVSESHSTKPTDAQRPNPPRQNWSFSTKEFSKKGKTEWFAFKARIEYQDAPVTYAQPEDSSFTHIFNSNQNNKCELIVKGTDLYQIEPKIKFKIDANCIRAEVTGTTVDKKASFHFRLWSRREITVKEEDKEDKTEIVWVCESDFKEQSVTNQESSTDQEQK